MPLLNDATPFLRHIESLIRQGYLTPEVKGFEALASGLLAVRGLNY